MALMPAPSQNCHFFNITEFYHCQNDQSNQQKENTRK
jgi:hypothetical protein